MMTEATLKGLRQKDAETKEDDQSKAFSTLKESPDRVAGLECRWRLTWMSN